ncbi:MAG: flagellar export protein FliJ [Betaproteobacteria bacterium]|nr:flagellar export protein FliJ [Betaproteobacteria bacterium]
MAPNQSFLMLQQLAEQRRDSWTRKLGVALAQTQESRDRLQLLVDYRNDYQGRLERAARGGIAGEGLRNYQAFLANLERAIEQQARTLADLQADVSRLRAEIANEQRQIESYLVLQRRRARTETQREHRRQQSQQDEFATNSVIRLTRRGGGDD